MTQPLAHQIATRAIGGVVVVIALRDPASGSASFGVKYTSGGTEWTSGRRFEDVDKADAGAAVLADFLGCEVKACK